jgi:hypothetical protein
MNEEEMQDRMSTYALREGDGTQGSGGYCRSRQGEADEMVKKGIW